MAAMLLLAGSGASLAQQADETAPDSGAAAETSAAAESPETASETGGVALELNKLVQQGDSCRAYVVIRNQGDRHYESFKLDLIEFRTDGIIGHRFAIDLGPIRPEKTLVKLFDIADTACEEIGSFLINDIMECSTDSGAIDDCFSGLSVSTRADAELTK
ncbi:hypothetical protein [Methyloligella solikamskensis]|uniref:Tat pathway signal sequence domain protein n=1 Tax=Methyloligella solikamskensis TaxID=1177756 RepID=A0ABW3J9F7_9HYPH